MRVRFVRKGGQRKFLEMVRDRLNVSSVRGVLQFGVSVSYFAMKSYYSEDRLMPKDLVVDLCDLAGIDYDGLDVEELGDNWGKVKGGRRSRR